MSISCAQYELWMFKGAENFKLTGAYFLPSSLQNEGQPEKGPQGQGRVEGQLPPQEED